MRSTLPEVVHIRAELPVHVGPGHGEGDVAEYVVATSVFDWFSPQNLRKNLDFFSMIDYNFSIIV
jgi:hypothetical protein